MWDDGLKEDYQLPGEWRLTDYVRCGQKNQNKKHCSKMSTALQGLWLTEREIQSKHKRKPHIIIINIICYIILFSTRFLRLFYSWSKHGLK